ncbi:MAG: hypothetical protein HUK03_06795 [Bacteroidaceae bacterium]|nr:hypothetical protein [Bacteroidaceae bacterium]
MATNDPLLEIQQEKQRLNAELEQSRQAMRDCVRKLVEPGPRPVGRIGTFSSIITNGMALVEGVRLGLGIVKAVRSLFYRK